MIGMSSVHNSVETLNAAATAIATAEIRVQPPSVQKRRWGSWWSLYWCFGSHKIGKRIRHAVLVPESSVPMVSSSLTDDTTQPTTLVLPFIAPPSSPASFLQSDPPSATLSPARTYPLALSLSVDSSSPGVAASGFAIGPYAHETQLVSPPVFSTFTTEPSTASFTPPPESTQFTTPSSPEVPFSQLVSSSLARSRRKSEANQRFPWSQYDYQPYQSTSTPGSRIISPGSTIPNSGTSSPFVGKDQRPISYDHFARKWGGSRLGSGTLTPNNGGISILGFGDCYLPENEISEVVSLSSSGHESENEENIVDHRLSFELTGVPNHNKNDPININKSTFDVPSSSKPKPEPEPKASIETENGNITKTLKKTTSFEEVEEKLCMEKRQSSSLGSSKDFNFDNMKQESLDKSTMDCDWWTSDVYNVEDIKDLGTSDNKWNFFPMLHHGVSL